MSKVQKIIDRPKTGLEEMFVVDAVTERAKYIVANKEAYLKEVAEEEAEGKRRIIDGGAWIRTAEYFLEELTKE